MSIPCKFERSILSYDEHEIVMQSHHPNVYDVGLDDLRALRQRLRDMRGRERTLAREKRRETRGKAAPRGASFPGTSEHPLRRKQAFAAALKRVNKEIDRMQKLEARSAACRGGPPRAGHAPCGAVSAASPNRQRGRPRHASAAKSTAANKSIPCKDRRGITSHKECAGRSRRPQQVTSRLSPARLTKEQPAPTLPFGRKRSGPLPRRRTGVKPSSARGPPLRRCARHSSAS